MIPTYNYLNSPYRSTVNLINVVATNGSLLFQKKNFTKRPVFDSLLRNLIGTSLSTPNMRSYSSERLLAVESLCPLY